MKSNVTVILPVSESLWVSEMASFVDAVDGVIDECKKRGWNVQTTDEAMGKVISPCDELSKMVADVINAEWQEWADDMAISYPARFYRAVELLSCIEPETYLICDALRNVSDEMELSADSGLVKRDIVTY
jgi:hypothetical protein